MEIRFNDKQEENIFIGGVTMVVIAGLAVVASIIYSIFF